MTPRWRSPPDKHRKRHRWRDGHSETDGRRCCLISNKCWQFYRFLASQFLPLAYFYTSMLREERSLILVTAWVIESDSEGEARARFLIAHAKNESQNCSRRGRDISLERERRRERKCTYRYFSGWLFVRPCVVISVFVFPLLQCSWTRARANNGSNFAFIMT